MDDGLARVFDAPGNGGANTASFGYDFLLIKLDCRVSLALFLLGSKSAR
jgi:hypothetical protein